MAATQNPFPNEEPPTVKRATVPERTIAKLYAIRAIAQAAREALDAMQGNEPLVVMHVIEALQDIEELAEDAQV